MTDDLAETVVKVSFSLWSIMGLTLFLFPVSMESLTVLVFTFSYPVLQAALETDPLAFVMVPRNQTRTVIQHGMPDAMVG